MSTTTTESATGTYAIDPTHSRIGFVARHAMVTKVRGSFNEFTGAGYFWPAWVLGCWGAGLVLHAWEAFVRRPITDSDIDAELRRHRH